MRHGVTEQRPHHIEQFLLHRLVLVDLRGNKAQEFERRRKAAFGQRLDGLIKHRQKRRGRRKVHDGWRHRNNKSIRRAQNRQGYGAKGWGRIKDDDIETISNARDALREAIDKPPLPRSEEHTSELQSLMRISYAVFCLK